MKVIVKYVEGYNVEEYNFDSKKTALEFLKKRFGVKAGVAVATLTTLKKIGVFARLWRLISVYLFPDKYVCEKAQRVAEFAFGFSVVKEFFKTQDDVVEELEKLERESK